MLEIVHGHRQKHKKIFTLAKAQRALRIYVCLNIKTDSFICLYFAILAPLREHYMYNPPAATSAALHCFSFNIPCCYSISLDTRTFALVPVLARISHQKDEPSLDL